MSLQQDQAQALQAVIAKAWGDPEYKEQLLSDPKAVLREAGVSVPDSFKIKIVADTDDTLHFVLPTSPAGDAIPDDALEQIWGGSLPDTLRLDHCMNTHRQNTCAPTAIHC